MYFSKMAETFLQSGDIEAARFYAGMAFEGGANSPIAINYEPPRELLESMDSNKIKEIASKYTKFASYYRMAIPKLDGLKKILGKLEEMQTKKVESTNRMKEAEAKIKDWQAQRSNTAIADKKGQAEIDDLMAQALALKEKAETEYQEALLAEEKLLQEKHAIENELHQLKERVLAEKSAG